MRTSKKGSDWSQLWKRNAVVAAIALFVCAAVYLNWNYGKDGTDTDAGKTLGQSTMVGNQTKDPLVKGDSSATTGTAAGDSSGETQTGGEVQQDTGAESSAYFATARLNRQQARDSALGILRETVGSEAAEESAKLDAGAAIEALAASAVSEAQIENLVIAKGYTDCVTFISEGGVSVVVSATENGIGDADVAKIAEIVTAETGVPLSQVTIIEAVD